MRKPRIKMPRRMWAVSALLLLDLGARAEDHGHDDHDDHGMERGHGSHDDHHGEGHDDHDDHGMERGHGSHDDHHGEGHGGHVDDHHGEGHGGHDDHEDEHHGCAGGDGHGHEGHEEHGHGGHVEGHDSHSDHKDDNHHAHTADGHHDHGHEKQERHHEPHGAHGRGAHGHGGHVEDDQHHHGTERGHGSQDHSHRPHGGHGHGVQAAAAPKRSDDRDLHDRWVWAYGSALGMSVLSFSGVLLLALLNVPALSATVEYASLSFAGTTLVADALLHLLPHALEGVEHESMVAVGLSAVAGCMSILAIPEVLEWRHSHGHEHEVQSVGIANLLTEMLHNFVDGITLGLAWLSGTAPGLGATIAVAVHELPQELGDFMVLRSAGFPVPSLLLWNCVASLTCVLGVALVHAAGASVTTQLVQRHMTAFTGGSFLSLALNMIFPQVSESIRKHHTGAARAAAKAFCLALGLAATYILVRIGDLEAHDHAHGHGEHHGHAHGVAHGGNEL